MISLGPAACLLLACLAAMLLAAMVTDLRSRTIANGLTLAVAMLAVPWWFAIGLTGGAMLAQFGIAAGVLVLFAGCFALGMMGGGDVKLIAALALWLPLGQLVQMLLWMAIGGGVLTLAMLVRHRLARAEGTPEIPYGVAIAGATLLVLANDILTKGAA